jgi:hypothetical protein
MEHKHRRREKVYGLEERAGVYHRLGRPNPPAAQRISGHGEVTVLGDVSHGAAHRLSPTVIVHPPAPERYRNSLVLTEFVVNVSDRP